jgi:hypothetical protein
MTTYPSAAGLVSCITGMSGSTGSQSCGGSTFKSEIWIHTSGGSYSEITVFGPGKLQKKQKARRNQHKFNIDSFLL